MDYDVLFNKAKLRIEGLHSNEVFTVKSLFLGTEWNKLKRGEKLGFGRYFKYAVTNGIIQNVEYIGKTDNNSAQYRKK